MTSDKNADHRLIYRAALIELAEDDHRVVCVDSDTGGLENSFGERFPQRYFNLGIAEQNMMSFAAGLAAKGLLPYVHTMAAFASLRAAEQLKLDIVGNRLPVRIVATHAGLAAAHFGTSHYALEDLAVMRALRDITVVIPTDCEQITQGLRSIHVLPGPAYVRLGRAPTPTPAAERPPFCLGRAEILRNGDDVLLIATGPWPVLMALEAADTLAGQGLSCTVLEVHTLYPFDHARLLETAIHSAGVVTVEEHRPQGGLGDAVAQTLGANHPVPHERVAVSGEVGLVVRDHRGALEDAGLSVSEICAAAARVAHRGGRRPSKRRIN